MSEQTIVAVYDTPAHAELAVQDLLEAGIADGAIQRHAAEGIYAGRDTALRARPEERGFWASLFGGEPDHDVAVYDRSLNSGANAVSVRLADTEIDEAMLILERHSPIDMEERATQYGLAGSTARTDAGRPASPPGGQPSGSNVARDTDRDALQLSAEQLSVGKRVVNTGTTRIRRFVVETPVEEQVRLRDERVTVDRRPVADQRPAADAFSDKVIEMTETAEEAVVSKTARVVEEVGLRLEAGERTETVRDTVRREDVEIVKDEARPAVAGAVGGAAPAAPRR